RERHGAAIDHKYADRCEQIRLFAPPWKSGPFRAAFKRLKEGLQPLCSTWAWATDLAQPHQHSHGDGRHQYHPNQILMRPPPSFFGVAILREECRTHTARHFPLLEPSCLTSHTQPASFRNREPAIFT